MGGWDLASSPTSHSGRRSSGEVILKQMLYLSLIILSLLFWLVIFIHKVFIHTGGFGQL